MRNLLSTAILSFVANISVFAQVIPEGHFRMKEDTKFNATHVTRDRGVVVLHKLHSEGTHSAFCRIYTDDSYLLPQVSEKVVYIPSNTDIKVIKTEYWESNYRGGVLSPNRVQYFTFKIESLGFVGEFECTDQILDPKDSSKRTGLEWLTQLQLKTWFFDFDGTSPFLKF